LKTMTLHKLRFDRVSTIHQETVTTDHFLPRV